MVRAICDKLVRRHPHVFGDASIETAQAQTEAWEQRKSEERAARAGLVKREAAPVEPVAEQAIGEMLFAVVTLAERAGIDQEQALRNANAAFEARIRARE